MAKAEAGIREYPKSSGTKLPLDPPAAEDAVARIEDAGLSRRHAELRLRQCHLRPILTQRADGRWHRCVAGADLDLGLHLVEVARADPVHVRDREVCPGEGGAGPDDHPSLGRIEAYDVQRLALGPAVTESETTALPHGEAGNPFVPAEYTPVDVDDLAGLHRLRPQPVQEGNVSARRHEADVLAVRLRGHFEAETFGQCARFALLQIAQREAQE